MPYVKISPPTGPLNVFYSISTPASHNADSIIPGVPTILFLHPVYMPQQIFQAQFSDYDLRQFNLVAFDMRSHGQTQGVIGEAKYTPAEDAYHFMEALKLPPCHLFALSIACCVALELASSHPDRFLSLTLCSPPTPVEAAEVASARIEVHEEWSEALMLPDRVIHQSASREDRLANLNMQFRTDALVGVKQLAFNNEMDALKLAITESTISQAAEHWIGTPERCREAFRAVILWPLERRAITQTELAKIKCPVNIIYCTEDVVYSVEKAQVLEGQLKDVGLSTKLYQVPGSHYGCVAGAKEINPIIRELVISCHDIDELPSIPLTADADGMSMKTPFDERLEKYDYHPSDYSEIQFSGLQYARF